MSGSVKVGMAEKKASKAASPPADAPIPTIGKSFPDSITESAVLPTGFGDPFFWVDGTSLTALAEDAVDFFEDFFFSCP